MPTHVSDLNCLTAVATARIAVVLLFASSISLLAHDANASGRPDPIPPFLSQSVAPNLILTVDDSASMASTHFGETIEAELTILGTKWLTSHDANPLYFDPGQGLLEPQALGVAYPVPNYSDGTTFAIESDLTDVLAYPFSGDETCPEHRINLKERFVPLLSDALPADGGKCRGPEVTALDDSIPAQPPYYHKFDEEKAYRAIAAVVDGQVVTTYEACADDLYGPDCLVCGEVHNPPDHRTPDICFNGPIPVADVDMSKFARWYKFYRTRLHTVKSTLSRSLLSLNEDVRVTYQGLEEDPDTRTNGLHPDTPEFARLVERFKPFVENKVDLYDWLFRLPVGGGSWLVTAQIRAGEFVSQGIALADDIGGYAQADPEGTSSTLGAACRNNFHLLVTDGHWEDAWGETVGPDGSVVGETWPDTQASDGRWLASSVDGAPQSLPTTPESLFGDIDYTPQGPYSDQNVGMLADAAFYYWMRDLRSDIPNLVPALIAHVEPGSVRYDEVNFWSPLNDPADWQHLTLFTVGYGLVHGIELLLDANGEPNKPFGRWSYQGSIFNLEEHGFPSCTEPYGAVDAHCDLAVKAMSEAVPAEAKSDDLYHAAINARGRYFSATDVDKLTRSFQTILSTVSAAAESEIANTPVAITADGLREGSLVYQAVSNSEEWSGELRAIQMSLGPNTGPCPKQPRGALCQDPATPYKSTKDADAFPDWTLRPIFTSAKGAAVAFDDALWPKLSLVQQRALLGCTPVGGMPSDDCDPQGSVDDNRALAEARIAWLRGNDEVGVNLRRRDTLLGDILGSGPVLVGPPRQLFTEDDYRTFKRDGAVKDRAARVYVGANDGMLHAFDAETLKEVFAYVPEAVYPRLADLSDAAYGGADSILKTAFVDGPINTSDAKLTGADDSSRWRTVLVGALGAGAQGIYALDITDPSPKNATDVVLWEFTDASGSDADNGERDGRDMGYNLATPAIVRIGANPTDNVEPTWVVLVGNGYASTDGEFEDPNACIDDDQPEPTNCTISQTGNAVLYVLSLGGGADTRILARLDTGEGPEVPATGDANGLMAVSTLDENGDLIADRAYAGDLHGNLWRFDLKDLSQPPKLLFRAVDESGDAQPITSRVIATPHPNGGHMLLFGTGRFVYQEDKREAQVQTFYGIWDDDGLVHPGSAGGYSVPSRSDLLQHAFIEEVDARNEAGAILSRGRTSTTDAEAAAPAGAVRGWLIDLVLADGEGEGERVVVAPQVRQGRVVFASMIPGGVCKAGGTGWINALDAIDGSRLPYTPFDYNLDTNANAQDLLEVAGGMEQIGSSIRPDDSGIYAVPSLLDLGGGEILSVISDSAGDLIQLQETGIGGWRTWLQLE
jgi:type IV pilus assembly protein PilY1